MKKIFLLFALCGWLAVYGQSAKVDAIGITVSDMDRSLRFYQEVLGFKKLSDQERYGTAWENLFGLFGIRARIVRLQLGDENIELIDYLTAGGRPIPDDARSNDLAFQHIAIVVSDMDSAYKRLRDHGVVHISTAPQTLPASIPAAAGIRAFYFQDPDKHNLEIIFYPKGKGKDKWQRRDGRIFLGIDHTAIGISNTNHSHSFYHDLIGVERKGDSWNKGIEQAHLNNVEDASLHITGYAGTDGPGVEFLEYLYPGPGKSYPADTRSDDLWNWYTRIEVKDASELFQKLVGKYKMVSRGMVAGVGGTISFIVRDPDGHALLIEQAKKK